MSLLNSFREIKAGKSKIANCRNEADTIVLAGNPNTGKSTIFNALTGLRQHTGNWPGKTVLRGEGYYKYSNKEYFLIDLPGTYSLFPNSEEEKIARDFICYGDYQVIIAVIDATSLERNLNLALQILEMTNKVVVCVNLLDEAKKKGICLDLPVLEKELGVPVVGTNARAKIGLEELKKTVEKIIAGEIETKPRQIIYEEEIEKSIAKIQSGFKNQPIENINPRWLALRLLEGEDLLEISTKESDINNQGKTKTILLEG